MDIRAALGDWMDADGPLYARLARGIIRAVRDGALPLGTRLPPERQLAQALAVSRSTVAAAYEQLKAERWLESRQGSGTWVREPRRDWEEVDARDDRMAQLGRSDVLRGVPFRSALELTAAAVDADPAVAEVAVGLDAELAALRHHHGYAPFGLDVLRQAVADHITADGLPTVPEQVLVTTGAVQAIFLAGLSYLRPGDSVVMESPGYPGALDAFRAVNARLRPLPVGRDGARRDVLDDLLGRTGARLAYLVPTFQNPTGALMSAGGRREVARIAREHHVPVLEDDVLRGTQLDDDPLPVPIAAADQEGFVLTLGSMSKLFWGGLRVGWLRGPEHVVARLARLKAAVDLGTPFADQILSARLLVRAEEVVARRRAALTARVDLLDELLGSLLPDWSYERPRGGLSLWVRLPRGDAGDFAQVALRHGVAVVPGGVFAADEGSGDHLRIPFVRQPAVLEAAVTRLAAAWRAYSPERTSRTVAAQVIV